MLQRLCGLYGTFFFGFGPKSRIRALNPGILAGSRRIRAVNPGIRKGMAGIVGQYSRMQAANPGIH
jgi:hypothetical protein